MRLQWDRGRERRAAHHFSELCAEGSVGGGVSSGAPLARGQLALGELLGEALRLLIRHVRVVDEPLRAGTCIKITRQSCKDTTYCITIRVHDM